ncbi:VirB4 family type IV secretion system protein [Halobacterium salinarum]|uniref:VirB4 family type IV secretion system protein n=1 Tax=Halobacterium salinarum TaxID=2242 RepID=UPI001F27F611|nr:TraM recognition domain-containing protein [Halobacterium salinarum]MCF2165451.1 TraM recognition domain-containing protein [Halobacterium salinarum]MCF2168316.1 TraM recognition domain-containing protein [Halobacterium salinarum]
MFIQIPTALTATASLPMPLPVALAVGVLATLCIGWAIAAKLGVLPSSSNKSFVDAESLDSTGSEDVDNAEDPPGQTHVKKSSEDETTDLDAIRDGDKQVLDDPGDRQLASMAPGRINEDENNHEFLRIDDKYTRSYFIDGWPEAVSDGEFRGLWTQPGLDYDISVNVSPVETPKALEDLTSTITDLQSEHSLLIDDGKTVAARDVERQLGDYRGMRDAIRDTNAEYVDVSMFTTISASTTEELDHLSDEFERTINEKGLNPVLATKDQERTLRSTSPIAKDELGKPRSMMGGVVGAMFPFSSGTLIQEQGIPIGIHAENRTPIIYDRFSHERGYNMMTIGNIGVGKTFSTSVLLSRYKLYSDDTIIIMMDPLREFAGLNTALDGQQIVVGGDFALNPLEIKEPPESVKKNSQVNPGAAKMKDLKSFFETFFDMRGEELGEKWTTLQRALRTSYHECGIDLADSKTHWKQSPTIADDLVPILLEMVIDVEGHSIIGDIVDNEDVIDEVLDAAEQVTDKERTRAADLLLAMEPFLDDGSLSNLGTNSQFDIENEDVVWLDLQQQESRGGTGLMMNLLFSAVYERAKQTDKQVIFAIDEARYIMRDKSALEFLEQAVRHSRHYDLSIQFITQTVDEFFQHEEAEAIADQCDHKLIFHTEGLDNEIAQKIGMNETQAEFARSATPGDSERGYSEAAFGVTGKGWFPVHISANGLETAVAELDADEDIQDEIPGMQDGETESDDVQEIKTRLNEKYEEAEVTTESGNTIPEVHATDGDESVKVDAENIRGSSEDVEELIDKLE